MILRAAIYLLVFLLEICLTALIISPEWIRKELAQEQQYVVNALGARVEHDLREESAEAFRTVFVNTGIVRASYDLFIPTEQQRQNSRGLEELGGKTFVWVGERLNALWNQIYQMFYRMSVLLAWAPAILPLAIPAVVDGLSMREIKKATYGGYASPVRYHAMTHAIMFLVLGVPIYIGFPMAVSPMLIPIWAILICVALMVFTANIQKRL